MKGGTVLAFIPRPRPHWTPVGTWNETRSGAYATSLDVEPLHWADKTQQRKLMFVEDESLAAILGGRVDAAPPPVGAEPPNPLDRG